MPLEVVHQRYLYRRGWSGISRETSGGKPFCYNSLHDVESLWWIGLFFMMNRTVADHDCTQLSRSGLFGDDSRRYLVLESDYRFSEELRALHPSLRPYSQYLIIALEHLMEGYRYAEREDKIDLRKVMALMVQFQNDFYTITSRLRTARDFEVIPLEFDSSI